MFQDFNTEKERGQNGQIGGGELWTGMVFRLLKAAEIAD
jgi:hypothetical protein